METIYNIIYRLNKLKIFNNKIVNYEFKKPEAYKNINSSKIK